MTIQELRNWHLDKMTKARAQQMAHAKESSKFAAMIDRGAKYMAGKEDKASKAYGKTADFHEAAIVCIDMESK